MKSLQGYFVVTTACDIGHGSMVYPYCIYFLPYMENKTEKKEVCYLLEQTIYLFIYLFHI